MSTSTSIDDIIQPFGKEKNFEDHFARFAAFVHRFISEDPDHTLHYVLKRDHTSRVFAAASSIATAESTFINPTLRRALLLAALYHDIGRFPQFFQYKTFSDAHSVNHGQLGVSILAKEKMLEEEQPYIRKLARTGVCLHNVYVLPEKLPQDSRLVLEAVRDADKIDIVRVLAKNLGPGKIPDPAVVLYLKDEPDKFSQPVLESVCAGKIPSFLAMRYINDFRILLCSWPKDLHFSHSRSMMREEGYLRTVADGFQAAPEVRQILLQTLEASLAS